MNVISEIYSHYRKFLNKIPPNLHDQMLLTGGTVAFLLDSDRPFSNDLDFMVAEEHRKELEDVLKIKFSINKKKPVFHSLAGHLKIGTMNYDVILNSVIEPVGSGMSFEFRITPKILARKMVIMVSEKDSKKMYCVPRELLLIMKLTAGRGQELGKYDLYDAHCILKSHQKIDREFLLELIREFDEGGNLKRLLRANLERIKNEFENLGAWTLLSW